MGALRIWVPVNLSHFFVIDYGVIVSYMSCQKSLYMLIKTFTEYYKGLAVHFNP